MTIEDGRGKPGPKPHQPTEQSIKLVEAMVACGVPQIEVAAVIGIDPKTLRLYYSETIAVAATKANTQVAQSLFNKATSKGITGPSVTAAIFWLKCRAGWRHAEPDQPQRDEGWQPPMGKKEQAALAAQTAGMDTDWGDDLMPHGKAN